MKKKLGTGKSLEQHQKEQAINLIGEKHRHVVDFLTTEGLYVDEITGTPEVAGELVDDRKYHSLVLRAKNSIPKLSDNDFATVFNSHYIPTLNPLKEFFVQSKTKYNPQANDNLKRLFSTLSIKPIDGMTKEDSDVYYYEMFKAWFIGSVAQVLRRKDDTKCVNLLMLWFLGRTNTGKSSWFRQLLPPALCGKWFGESHLEKAKDDEMLMAQKMILFVDDKQKFTRMDAGEIRRILSAPLFSLRPPYGKVNIDMIRRATLCGTTNNLSIIPDAENNRRMLPFYITSMVDWTVYNSIDKAELWAEVYAMYEKGETFALTDEINQVIKSLSKDHSEAEPETDAISRLFMPDYSIGFDTKTEMLETEAEYLTATEILNSVAEKYPKVKFNATSLGLSLKKLGFDKIKKRVGVGVTQVYKVHRFVNIQTSGANNYPFNYNKTYGA